MIAVLGLALTMVVRQWRSDFLPLIRVCIMILFATLLLTAVTPIFDFIRSLTQSNGMTEYITTLLKALGIALLTEICANICRESGENGIAAGVEMTGKLEILLLCLPLMGEILTVAKDLMEMGGGV